MELCKEVDPFLGIISDEKWLSTYSSKVDPSSAVRAEFPEFSNSKFNVTEENKMHAEFTRVAQEILDAGSAAGGRKNSVRTLVVKDTGNHPDIEEKKKPDLTFYPDTPEARKAFELSQAELKNAKVTPEERRKYLGRAAWPHACLFVEFKAADHKNPFEKQKDEYVPRDTDDAKNARGQMYEYATAIMNAQPRTHVFFISIWRTQATLFYADHSQFVCTKPFTFTGKSSALSTFLYHLGQMNPEELGYDSSVTLATAEELAAVKDVEDQMTEYHQKCVAGAFFSESGWPVYKVILPAEQAGFKQSKEDGVFLIGRPLYKIYSPTGRATKVYAAYNVRTERMGTVKDCWPEEWEEGEHTKYECIQEAKVRYTATCLYGGYVGEQKTKTCDDLKHTRPVRRHYRIVLKELGRPLDSYTSSGELIVAGFCVLKAHQDAWKKCGLLQRDMSPYNMVFDEVDPRDLPKGQPGGLRRISALLIDWHLAKFEHELRDGAKRVGRSGTWQFISARLLRNPTAQNEVADDLESVILIMEWMALRFHGHQYRLADLAAQPDWLKGHVENFFELRAHDDERRDVGGYAKYRQWKSGERDWLPINTTSAFAKLLDSLLKLAHDHYVALEAGASQPPSSAEPTFESHFTGTVPDDPESDSEDESLPEPGPSAVKTTDLGALSLATHGKIVATFREAMKSLSSVFKIDKVSDKFENIGMATEKYSLVENTKQSKQSKKKTISGQQEIGLLRRSTRLSAKASAEGDQAEGSSKPVKRRSGQVDGLEEKDEAKRQATGVTRKGSRLRKSAT